ncbi:MAG: N-acetylmuramoyl-L-alanine amidase family protein [Flammeovirgaceae bacterium]
MLKTVVIDAGHGGKDPGCLGSHSMEKNIALDVALQLGKLIERLQPDIHVIYTRTSDTFIPLERRADIANKAGADLFISIHCNAHQSKEKFGTETYIMGLHVSKSNLRVAMRENSVILQENNHQKKYKGFNPNSPASYILLSNLQSAHQDNSLLLAHKIEGRFHHESARHSRGVKQSGFWVLARTGMPSVLVEIGFLTNPEEEKYLNTELGKASMAASLYRAFRDYRKALEKTK